MLIMQIKDFLIYLFEHTVYIFSGISIKELLAIVLFQNGGRWVFLCL